MVRRSYPACEPVRTASTYTDRGGCCPVKVVGDAQTNGWLDGVAAALGLGDWVALGVGVGLAPAPGRFFEGRWFSGLATNSTPITTTAITAAARPAIQ